MQAVATTFAVALVVLIIAPVLYLTYVSYQEPHHSPPNGRPVDDATANE